MRAEPGLFLTSMNGGDYVVVARFPPGVDVGGLGDVILDAQPAGGLVDEPVT